MRSLDYPEDILIEISQYASVNSLLAWAQANHAHHETLTRVILRKLGPCQYRPMREWDQDASFTASSNSEDRPYFMRLNGGALQSTPRLSRGAVLLWAASQGHVRLVRNILSMQEMGPWINMPILSSGHGTSLGSFGMTPLHAAAKEGHAEVIDLLIEYGADVEATMAGNLRPIHFANNESVVMALVRHGSSIYPQGRSTVPPLTYVLTTKPHLSAIQCLLRLGCNPNAATWLGFTAADAAVQTGNVEALQLLLDAGLDISPSVSGGESVIYKAIYCFQNNSPDLTLRLVGLLTSREISGKVDLLKYDPRQRILAISARDPEHPRDSWTSFVKLFPEIPSLFTRLFLSAMDAPIGHEVQDTDWYLSMAFSLFYRGASLDVQRESSILLKFFLSCEYDSPKVLERIAIFLLARLSGAPISHGQGQGTVIRSPIHLLFTRGYNFFDTNTNSAIALRLLGYFLRLGVNPNKPDSEGNTPLALLCQIPFHPDEGHTSYLREAANKLLCSGADINTLWKAKNCAIYGILAQVTTWKWCRHVYGFCFYSWRRRDCHLEHRDSDGMSPLGRATAILFTPSPSTQWWHKKKKHFASRRADFVKALLEMGADVHAVQGTSKEKPLCSGGTPLHFACYDFDPLTLMTLLSRCGPQDLQQLTDTGFTPLMLVEAAVNNRVLEEKEAGVMKELLRVSESCDEEKIVTLSQDGEIRLQGCSVDSSVAVTIFEA